MGIIFVKFASSFGIGALGPSFAGFLRSDQHTYVAMAGVISVAGIIALTLNRRQPS